MLACLGSLLFAVLATAPAAGAVTQCGPWSGNGFTKTHTCASTDNGLRCVLWSEGWIGSSPYYVCWVGLEP